MLLLLALLTLQAPTPHPCETATGPFTVPSGVPLTLSWVMPLTAPTPTGPVANRIDGFYLQMDNGPRQDLGMVSVGEGICDPGTPQAGQRPYWYSTPSGVGAGVHQALLTPWNAVVNAQGQSVRQEGVPVVLPFTAVAPPPPPADPCVIAPLTAKVTGWPSDQAGSRRLSYSTNGPARVARVLVSFAPLPVLATFTDTRGCTVTVTR